MSEDRKRLAWERLEMHDLVSLASVPEYDDIRNWREDYRAHVRQLLGALEEAEALIGTYEFTTERGEDT